ncbi:unnamed protein product [Ectocarpus sp. CCAP 1310/34]|nr:unnamed protein product [Ectocarpus sp. CCAP 1310/34]
MVDFIFEILTSQQLAELLRALLEHAAAKGNKDLAQRLVRAGAEIGDALHRAVDGGHREIVSDLLESEASLAATDMDGRTPLHIAAEVGDADMVQLLLLKGATTDVIDNQEMTPLIVAACCNQVAAALALLAAGADITLRSTQFKCPATHAAALEGHVEILRAIIEHGADVDAVDAQQRTALHAASCFNKTEAVDVLVEAGAHIEARDKDGCPPLHYAFGNLSHEALLCLLKHGANVNAQSNSLLTPLMKAGRQAGRQGAAEVVNSLLRAGADETIANVQGNKAVDMIGEDVEEEDRLTEDVERVRELLANAPADRAWRRRGYLIMCRAQPDRVPERRMTSGTHYTNVARRTRSRAKMARARGIAGESTVDESTGGNWAVVVSKVISLQEEGIFRTIVEYL